METTDEPRRGRRIQKGEAGPIPGPSLLGPSHGQRRSRRLWDKVLLTFHAACDVREFRVARQLLATLEDMLLRTDHGTPADLRRTTEALVAAHERLWHLTRSFSLS